MLIFIIIAIPFIGLGIYFAVKMKMQMTTVFFILGVVLLLVSFFMNLHKKRIMNKIQKIYVSHMDREFIFKTAIENLPGFELVDVSNNRSKNLNSLRYNIPSDATIVSSSQLFQLKFKKKYKVEFQTARYH